MVTRNSHARWLMILALALVAGTAVGVEPAQAIGGTGEYASGSPIAVQAGSLDMKITILGVVDVPVETTLVPFTDLKLSRAITSPTSVVTLAAKPTLCTNIYRLGTTCPGTRTHPYLKTCDRGETADPAQLSSVATWGTPDLAYPGNAVSLSAPGSTCGPVAQSVTQRTQWGVGAATNQMITGYATALGVQIGAPPALVPELPARTLVTATALSSRSACPSLATMAPAGAVSVTGLEILGGALRLAVTSNGALDYPNGVKTATGRVIPQVTRTDVNVDVPGMTVDTWFGSGLGRFTVQLSLGDLEGLIVGTTSTILGGAIGLDARLVIELDSRKGTSSSGGWATATAAALEVHARVEIELEDESYLAISNTAGTGPGRIILADTVLAASTCGWRRTGSSETSWLDPTLT